MQILLILNKFLMKKLFFLFVGSLIAFSSCTNEDEPLVVNSDCPIIQSRSAQPSDSVVYVDALGDIIYPNIASPYSLDLQDDSFSTYASDNVVSVVGYTSKSYINSKVMVFTSQPQDNRLSAWTYYIEDYYTYIYKITVPHGHSVAIPTSFDSSWATGVKPSDQSQIGYELVGPLTTGSNGDTYEMRTIIREVSKNSSGQSLGFTAYLPFRVGNPSTDLLFKYAVSDIDW